MWDKLKRIFSIPSEDKKEDNSELVFEQKDTDDVAFTKRFIESGGYFFYCENIETALENLLGIASNTHFSHVICFDKELQSYANQVGLKFDEFINSDLRNSFLKCEYLVAQNGSIVLSSHQTSGHKINELPDNIIIFAHPEQIVPRIDIALEKIKQKKGANLPSNITSIQGKDVNSFDPKSRTKNIYLLLVERTP